MEDVQTKPMFNHGSSCPMLDRRCIHTYLSNPVSFTYGTCLTFWGTRICGPNFKSKGAIDLDTLDAETGRTGFKANPGTVFMRPPSQPIAGPGGMPVIPATHEIEMGKIMVLG
jgi:hypothetical protein